MNTLRIQTKYIRPLHELNWTEYNDRVYVVFLLLFSYQCKTSMRPLQSWWYAHWDCHACGLYFFVAIIFYYIYFDKKFVNVFCFFFLCWFSFILYSSEDEYNKKKRQAPHKCAFERNFKQIKWAAAHRANMFEPVWQKYYVRVRRSYVYC